LIVAFSNFSGVVLTKKLLKRLQGKNTVSKFHPHSLDGKGLMRLQGETLFSNLSGIM